MSSTAIICVPAIHEGDGTAYTTLSEQDALNTPWIYRAGEWAPKRTRGLIRWCGRPIVCGVSPEKWAKLQLLVLAGHAAIYER